MPTPPTITPFQQKVFLALEKIPSGSVATYKRLAIAIGCKSAQAVGQALKRNPFAPQVPCHRVIPESRKIAGYKGKKDEPDVHSKKVLLISEAIIFDTESLVQKSHIINLKK